MPVPRVRLPAWVRQRVWKLECRMNRLIGRVSRATAVCEPVGASVDVLGGAEPSVPSPELLLVVMTHARETPCAALLESLTHSVRRAGLAEKAFALVVEDPSDYQYQSARSLLEREWPGRFAFYRFRSKLGKRGRWLTYQRAFDVARRLHPSHTLFFEDDVAIESSFVPDALTHWRNIADPKKAALYLCAFPDDEVEGRWIRFQRRALDGGTLRQTQWLDLHAFLAGPRFFEQLRYEVFQPPDVRWDADPRRSSGVSAQFTRRLFGRGNVYQVVNTMGLHGRLPSILNVEARAGRPLDNYPDQRAGSG